MHHTLPTDTHCVHGWMLPTTVDGAPPGMQRGAVDG